PGDWRRGKGRAGVHLADVESGVPARHGPVHSRSALLGARGRAGRWREREFLRSATVSIAVGGLYAITPDLADTGALLAKVEAALAGGARLLQYRNKVADPGLRLEQARGLARLCRGYRVPLIVNDHLDLALAVDAEGLHIGGEDGSVAEARRRIG